MAASSRCKVMAISGQAFVRYGQEGHLRRRDDSIQWLVGICMSCSRWDYEILSRFQDNQGGGLDVIFPMQRHRANAVDNSGCSIQEAAKALRLGKLAADVWHWGELIVRRTEIQRLLDGRATNPERSFNLC